MAMPAVPSRGEAAMQAHTRIDALAAAGHAGTEALVDALAAAVACLDPLKSSSLTSRLAALLHTSIEECGHDTHALEHWLQILDLKQASSCDNKRDATVQRSATSIRTALQAVNQSTVLVNLPCCSAASGSGDEVWSQVLRFLVSFEALAAGLCAVSRGFRQAALLPVCWEDAAVAFSEKHFREFSEIGATGCGWSRAFALLPSLSRARFLRVKCFDNHERREQVVQRLSDFSRALCPAVPLLACTFCEHHAGEHVELPSPRKLTACRRSGERGGGLLLGNGPLQVIKHNAGSEDHAVVTSRCFSILLEKLPVGDRVDIGVTSLPPHAHFAAQREGAPQARIARLAEELNNSWVVESSGLLVGSHAGVRIRDSSWDARKLVEGDEITLKVTSEGDLTLHVNGEPRGVWRARIPATAPLFPVVDLFEGAPTVHIIPDVSAC
mmetsp:Transcript_8996/g.16232  ORF Transcript_8996/g.16232 Transcript_8996/m.16232 type:complete len:440 (+) Transcript_8996:88-1407(+)